ncbi:MAG: glycosyltransferase [Chitinophagaceae bacterium]|nr:glycosyltransferase [Chitinophagaceae bacterium]MCW5925498.1 glycosyltransferase [Chitinophagaceae bacterium]
MYIIILLLLVLFTGYFAIIDTYRRWWNRIPVFRPGKKTEPDEKITIIIPARNEEQNIGACLEAILKQTYPGDLLEVIVVDDHSEDSTAAIVGQYRDQGVQLLSLKEFTGNEQPASYKKKAIEVAIARSAGTLIVTTDADCTAEPAWIATIARFHRIKKDVFIVAPVKMIPGKSLLSVFQATDFAILQGITAASVHGKLHNMCNGANLAYEKTAFSSVNGFAGIDHIASGDDMLLMDKIAAEYPQQIGYLNAQEAIVSTAPEPDIRAFFHQRIRWASKAASYKATNIKLILLLVLLVNICWLVLLVAGCFSALWFRVFLVAAFYKVIIEWPFVKQVLRFFSLSKLSPLFPLLQPLHVLYTIIAGFAGLFTRYEWKGRKVI